MNIYYRTRQSLCLLLAYISSILAIPNRPPGIITQPDQNVYFKPSETVMLPCRAEGYPDVKYTWRKNGIDFNPSGNDDRVVQYANSGTMVINRPEDKDEGIFQCIATNQYGVSVSVNVNLREAKLVNFPVRENVEHEIQLGLALTLTCVPPTSFPREETEVEWVLKDKYGKITAINYNNRITKDLEARLHFTNVKAEDYQGGKAYVCMAINYFMRKNTYDKGHIIIPTGNTEIKSIPEYLWASPTDHFGLEGETFKLKCIFSGNPTPEVYWQYPDGTKNKPDKVSVSLGGQEITVPELNQQDAGSYECYGKNSQGQRATRTFRIRVESKPTWETEPEDIETSIGATATYICKAKGIPTPQIYWYINGVLLEDSTNPTINSNKFLKPNKNNITFVNLDKSDTMVIQCNATNKHGYVFADVFLHVLEEAPQFIEAPHNKKTSEGQAVEMACRTSGKPDPTITWYRDGEQITGGRYKTLPNGNLQIQKVVLSDSGNYTCTAENRCGKNCGKIAGSGILIVRRRTRVEFKPSDLEIGSGKDGKFTCTGTTDFAEVEHLRIYWKKDGKVITSNDQRMTQNFQDNSLTISGTIARDSGVYTCVVTNGLDEATTSAILTVKARPDPPLDVVADSCSQTQAVISWTKGAPNNAPIQYFTIQYNTSFAPDLWFFAKKESSTQNKAYVPLTPWTKYTFRVLATNKIGTSEPSYHTTRVCETQPRRPSKNPENVRDIGDNPQSLIIDWTPMPEIEHNGPNFNYIITISNPGGTAIPPITITDWRVSRYEMVVNRPDDYFIAYNVTLKARNNVGESSSQLNTYQLHSGEYKPTIIVSTFAVDAVKLAATSAAFIWDWDREDEIDRQRMRGRFKGFKIQFWRKGAREQTFREIEITENHLTLLYAKRKKRSIDTLQTTITGLSPYTNMEAQIVVINTYYAGPPSLVVGFRTSEGVPGPVKSFSASLIGSNFVKLSWLPPDEMDRNGIILGYDVGYQTVKGLELGQMQDKDQQINTPYINNTILNGLVPSQKYRIHIWARTRMGRGEVYFIEVTTAKAGSQGVPSFELKNINSTFVNVSWTEIVNKNSGTVVYIEYRKSGTADWEQSTDEVAKNWIGIGDLESGTTYQLKLIVTNGKTRAKSGKVKFTTMGLASGRSLVANFGWFIGLILSLLVITGTVVLIWFLRKRALSKPLPERKLNVAPRQDGSSHGSEPPAYPESEQEFDRESSNKRSTASIDKGFSNRTYGDEKYGFNEKYEKDNNVDKRDSYNNERYDDDYDDRYSDDDHYSDRYDDDRYDDNYSDRYDDYERDDFDDRRRSYDKEPYDDRRRSYEKEPYDDYGYEPYDRRDDRGYDRQISQDDRRPSDEIRDYNTESSKFDSDGYPIEVKKSGKGTPSKNGSSSSFV